MESDKKAVAEFEKNLDNSILDKPKSVDRWLIAASDIPKIKDFIIKTRQEAREEKRQRILDLPCMQDEQPAYSLDPDVDERIYARNSLRREIRDALQSK